MVYLFSDYRSKVARVDIWEKKWVKEGSKWGTSFSWFCRVFVYLPFPVFGHLDNFQLF